MNKKLLLIIPTCLIVFLIGFLATSVTPVLALDFNDADDLLDSTREGTGLPATTTGEALELVIKVVNWILGLVGIAFILLVIYGGILIMTSGGVEQKITKGKDIIKWAAIGIIIIALSYLIVNAVLGFF